ncbi:MAG: hypothetical protein BWK73_10485 [Thiothrix lacustris]|uniref:Uncharacterized protein n=1 Tax=Thiothrix lacustris TaxID=525917 RepID=A0A1Y1QUF6_9GAMM|nr:MAG: hypothetical protein BWK73_10485 [Thiothrix lacustris]
MTQLLEMTGHEIDAALHRMQVARKSVYTQRNAYHSGFKAGCKQGIFAECPDKNTKTAFDAGVIDAVVGRGYSTESDGCTELLGGI